MPLTVYYNNESEEKCVISPTPFISISSQILKTGAGEAFGVTYQITLTGTIIANEGTPYAFKSNNGDELFPVYQKATDDQGNPLDEPTPIEADRLCGPYCSFDKTLLHKRPLRQQVDHKAALSAILSKQKALRALFALDGQRMEITDWVGLDSPVEKDNDPVLIFYPRINSISFQEGIYVDVASYTIQMEADVILSNPSSSSDPTNFVVDADASLLMPSSGDVLYSGIDGMEIMVAGKKVKTGQSGFFSSTTKVDLSPACSVDPDAEPSSPSDNTGVKITRLTEKTLELFNQYYISDFDESWSIEVDEQFGENFGDVPIQIDSSENPDQADNNSNVDFRDLIQPRSYLITHNVSAVGKTHYGPEGKTQAWEEAKKFVQNRLFHQSTKERPLASGYPNHPGYLDKENLTNDPDGNPQPTKVPAFFGKGALNLASGYNGFNHTRNENVGYSDGTYSVTETWLIASGTDFETYDMSITSSNETPFVNINVQGKIKGLSSIVPSSVYYGGQYEDHKLIEDGQKQDPRFLVTPYMNALEKWYKISKSGVFGYTSDLYRRANSLVAVELNSQPLEISLATNEFTGEIDYALSFDNRPTNIISGTLLENININETYPGDVFSVIPVIGRATGPVLQYNGSRTAYSREVTIDLTMDSTKIPYDTGRMMLIRKPSAISPTAEQLEKLIHELSPEKEPGVRKYFHDPPQESWNPKTGQYSIGIRWTYELDK